MQMKSRIILLLFFTGFMMSNLQAQMKQIKFSEAAIPVTDIKINPKTTMTEMNPERIREATFKSIDNGMLFGLKNGLKPGHLNDRQVPSYIEGELRHSASGSRSITVMAEEYLKAAAPAMKIKDPQSEFSVISDETDEIGMQHIRMQQIHKGIPVYGGQVVLHATQGKINFLNGSYYPSFELDNVKPSLTIGEGSSLAFADMGQQLVYDTDMSKFGDLSTQSELVVYPYQGDYFLVYHYTVYKNLIERWEYFIDATSGNIINKYESMCKFHNHQHDGNTSCSSQDNHQETAVLLDGPSTATALDLFNINRQINTYQVNSTYYMIDGARDIFSASGSKMPDNPSGVIWTINAFNTSPANNNFRYDHVTSSNNQWNNKTAVSAHYNGGKAFEYFRNTHNRRSINGNGGNIISFINVADDNGKSMGNAFWNGQAMFYGNGDNAFSELAKGLDVAGHEMSHGVIQGTANLDYEGESGALNESFADVFGVMIDRDDWLIGEDVVIKSAFPSGALRSMSDPHNGAKANDFNAGWQPRHYDERYKGSQDNGGVHINSGIPNYAFYKFATAVGKDKAEKVYYRAIANYLTKSSKFVDCRVAVVKAAGDLYSKAEVDAAKQAFDEVGIYGDKGGDYENDVDTNPGQEFVLVTGPQNNGIYILATDANKTEVAQLTSKQILSKPSISDDGSEIVYIGADKKMYYTTIDWTKGSFTPDQELSKDPIWRNVIISKDGSKLAALLDQEENSMYVFYFGKNGVIQNKFDLYNPTYSSGVKTVDVKYADAMEFDLSGEYVIYDAENEIKSNTNGSIQYWDISFVKVWNNSSGTFSLGEVSKLYSSLPEGTSIVNPSFSKNSPYIIAFDFIDSDGNVAILGANIERGETGLIFENNALGYPNYSSKDDKVVFDNLSNNSSYNIGVATMKTNKIEVAQDPVLFTQNKRWATWFSNGKRTTSSVDNFVKSESLFTIANNPVSQTLVLQFGKEVLNQSTITVTDVSGRTLLKKSLNQTNGQRTEVNVSALESGVYIVSVQSGSDVQSAKFVKQ